MTTDAYTVLADSLFDGRGGHAVELPALTITAGRVASLERRGSSWTSQQTPLDFRGCTIVPGLIDPHCHLALRPELEASESIAFAEGASDAEILAIMLRNGACAFKAGVTTARDCGSPRHTGIAFRNQANASAQARVPRVIVSGRPITTTSGHCHWMGLIADTASEAERAVKLLAEEGVDFIKVMATGGMMTAGSDPYRAQYSEAELVALVSEARRHSKRVAAHALSAPGVRAALAAGVDTIEHFVTTTPARQDRDPDLDALIASSGVVVGVTAHRPLRDLLDSEDLAGIRTRLAPHRALHRAGALMTVHSDAGPPGTSFDEFGKSVEIFRIGLETTIEEAVRAATLNAAIALGIESERGTLVPGRCADFVVLEGDLTTDDTALRRVVGVARDGLLVLNDATYDIH